MYKIRTKLQGDTPFFPNMLNNWNVEVCLKEDVDKALSEKDKALSEKDKEIALLKERICNGDVSRLTWIDDCIAKDKENAELKQKLENVQASMYADVVDANMENRRLKEERRWRKFPDEKPKWGEEVLVVDDENKKYIVRFSHDMKWISWGKMNTCESNCVKYWMPLPKAPKKANK